MPTWNLTLPRGTIGAALCAAVIGLLAVAGCDRAASTTTASSGSPANEPTSPDTAAEDDATVAAAADDATNAAADDGEAENEVAAANAEHPTEPPTDPSPADHREGLLEDWDKPAAAIVLTGEQHGRLEPCGCSERQSGGLARRADFVHQLKTRGWPVTGFDLGGAVERTRRQSEMKYEFTRDALNTIGYQGLGFGPEDLKFGADKLFTWFTNTAAQDDFDVPYLSANVTFYDTRDIGTPLSYRVIDVGGVKVAVTAVLGKSYLPELYPRGVNPDPSSIRIDDPAEVLPDVVKEMQAQQPDVMLLLSHARPEESEALAKAFPAFDLVVTAGGPEDPVGEPDRVGDSLLLRVGTKGKNVGIVGFYPEAADGKKFRFAVVELDRFRFGHAEAIDDRMREYQETLARENLLANEPAITHPRGDGFTFLGSEKCGECHSEAYDVWKTSHHHENGFKSLTVAFAQSNYDPSLAARVRVDRIHDPECICCHTAGWDPQEVLRFESGYLGEEKSAHLKGVHCESCHGPGSRHVQLEESLDASEMELLKERAAMAVGLEEAEVKVCLKCHDHENSPDFNFDTYWPQIEH